MPDIRVTVAKYDRDYALRSNLTSRLLKGFSDAVPIMLLCTMIPFLVSKLDHSFFGLLLQASRIVGNPKPRV